MSEAKEDGSVFQQTKRFNEALKIIEKVPAKRLGLLVSRILSSFAQNGEGDIFTEQEQQQLLNMLGFSEEELQTMLDVSLYILELAAYHRMSGGKLASSLQQAGMPEAPAQSFGQVWNEGRQPLLDRLRKHTLGAPQILESVSWRLQLTMAQQGIAQRKDINTLLNLRLHNPDLPEGEPGALENLVLELDLEQLQSMFQSMERVQEQLDQLSNQ